MIELALTICALTFVAPYYDCSEKWDIIVYDSTDLLLCGREEPSALGCSTYHKTFENDKIELVSNYYEVMGLHTPKLKSESILHHELLHQTCTCNWHEKWDKPDLSERHHKFTQDPKVPKNVIPYLKDKWI